MKRKITWLMLMLVIMGPRALASPELSRFQCTLNPTLNVDGVLAEPFDRWAEEFAALILPEIDYAQWPEGQALRIDVRTGDKSAFVLELLQNGELIALSSTLMGPGQVLLTGDQALDAMRLMDNVRDLFAPEADWPSADCTLQLNVERAAQQLLWLRMTLDRWSSDAADDLRERTEALMAICQAAEGALADEPNARPLLSVYVHYQKPGRLPDELDPSAGAAPADLLASMCVQLPDRMLRSIASLDQEKWGK